MENNNIMVSIACITYNHERYIRSALDGFLMQKTDFVYEILVHDDASTDKTALILKEYEQKYPDKVKPIYQKENQYSKGINIMQTYVWPQARGKYLAICEGDDYWTDPLKLQKQVEALENHPEINICAHSTRVEQGGKFKRFLAPFDKNIIITTREVICGGGGSVHASSLLLRRSILSNVPNFRMVLGMDYTLKVWGALNGGMYYLKDCMSVYRLNSCESSWSIRMSKNIDQRIQFFKKEMEMYNQLDVDTNHMYHDEIQDRILSSEFWTLVLENRISEARSEKYKKQYSQLSAKQIIKIYLRKYVPFMNKFMVKGI
jgi:glycosyltransferase involved in cell wall biosynthesis